MAPCLKLFQFAEASNKAASWRQHCLALFFQPFLHTLSHRSMLHTSSTGGLLNLSRLRAKTNSKRVLIRELLYANDAALVVHSEMHLQSLCERFVKACIDFSMTINLKKTVVMSLGTSIPSPILVNVSLLNVVDKFFYLGSVVNCLNNLDEEINQQIGKASINFGRLSSRVWKNHHFAIKLKIKVYTACILSVLLYSSETWCTYPRQENRLNAFHFRCLRSILDVSWRIMSPTPLSWISPVHMTSLLSYGSDVCAG